jgi:hexosaminidase
MLPKKNYNAPLIRLLLLLCFSQNLALTAKTQPSIIPAPQHVNILHGHFDWSRQTHVWFDTSGTSYDSMPVWPAISFFYDYLKKVQGWPLPIHQEHRHVSTKNLLIIRTKKRDYELEQYSLHIAEDSIILEAGSSSGIFYGIQSLIQLLPTENKINSTIPCVQMNDYPRFPYRGLHLDCARHMMPVWFVKKYIDLMALHKLNRFHWHLTEDQGWRIEIKKYPLLTSLGAYRKGTIIGHYPGTGNTGTRYGGYYTQDEIKEIVAHAQSKYITIIPEIEMPGHSMAALASYPYLGCSGGPYEVQQTWGVFDDVFCAGNDSVFTFLQNVLDEVVELFPSTYIHIGGDECPKSRWKTCPKCQQRMKENNIKDEHALQSYFIQRIEHYLASKGRRIIGWDEILEGGLAPNATVMSWRGEEGGIAAAKQQHYAIMTPGDYCYLDHAPSSDEDSLNIGGYLPIERIYDYDPVPASLADSEKKYIMGVQGNVWTEYMTTPEKVEYMVFPRLAALSEVAWTLPVNKNKSLFLERIPKQLSLYKKWQVNYNMALYEIKEEITQTSSHDGLKWELSSAADSIKYTRLDVEKSDFVLYTQPVIINQNEHFEVVSYLGGDITDRLTVKFDYHLASGKVITYNAPSSAYPGLQGASGLVNGRQSTKGQISPEWVGWYDKDAIIEIDLENKLNISRLEIHVLGATGSWIHFPSGITLSWSGDGKNFQQRYFKTSDCLQKEEKEMATLVCMLPGEQAKKLKLLIHKPGIIPTGFPGQGKGAWLFVDEIKIR